MLCRPRRLRSNARIRSLVQESFISAEDLVYPCFVVEGSGVKTEIESMPRIFRFSLDLLLSECEELLKSGICSIALFPVLDDTKKDRFASESANERGLYPRVIRKLKSEFPELVIFSDVAMDPYSSDGHDGLVVEGLISNDDTLPILAKMALVQAEAGCDFVSPSDMMDGRVGYIRKALDEAGHVDVGILSYSAKYASAFYGPFRSALDSAPKSGDKKTYQMNPANSREALRECRLDVEEGADLIMVKPGLAYLDVVSRVKEAIEIPLAVYNVSGEYSMLNAAFEKGLLDYQNSVMEVLTGFKRAGADLIFSYHSKEVASWIRGGIV